MKIKNSSPDHITFSIWTITILLQFMNCFPLLFGFFFQVGLLNTFSMWFSHPHTTHFLSKAGHLLEKGVVPHHWHLLQVLVLSVCELLRISLLCLIHYTTSKDFLSSMLNNIDFCISCISILFVDIRTYSLITSLDFLSIFNSWIIYGVIISSVMPFMNCCFEYLSHILCLHLLVSHCTKV